MEYLKFDKNFKTDRQWKIVSIDYRQLNELSIDPKRLNYDSVKFSNMPEVWKVGLLQGDARHQISTQPRSPSASTNGYSRTMPNQEIRYWTLMGDR